MNILGIGQAGVAVAEQFQNFPQYNVFFIDTENKKNHKIHIYGKDEIKPGKKLGHINILS